MVRRARYRGRISRGRKARGTGRQGVRYGAAVTGGGGPLRRRARARSGGDRAGRSRCVRVARGSRPAAAVARDRGGARVRRAGQGAGRAGRDVTRR
ncbi:hypothetical protein CYL17_09910 [Thermobispora bispora]|nr:hypothetical protein [Actinomycetales bacterium]QSI48129.1 hypothetical protein CYL17_09910 [Thermobispora bispora]